jgi:aminoglycoside 3-N-acetyltransferase
MKAWLPGFVIAAAKRLRRKSRKVTNKVVAGAGQGTLTRARLVEDLKRAGIQSGDILLVHSSLTKIGLVDGGPRAVVEAFLEVLGPSGTLVVPTIHLKSQAREHFASSPLFDVKNTASTMGAICEAARQFPAALRSQHPTHSVAAIGPQAVYLTEAHHLDERPFGPLSPFHRLAELKGKIVLLGVPLANMTNFHVIEDLEGESFPYAVYLPDVVPARVLGIDGVERVVKTRIHNPVLSAERRCNDLESLFLREGIMREAAVGRARTLVIDANRLNEVLRAAMRRNVTMYTPDGSPLQQLLRAVVNG